MIRKINIFLLAGLFSVSIIGIPLTQHFCKMMNEFSAEECSMCTNEIVETSCCELESNEKSVQFSTQDFQCCETSFEFFNIDETFFPTITQKADYQNSITDFVLIIDFSNEKKSTNYCFNAYDLPPPKFGKKLLQSIHQLKLDIPIC